MNKINGKRDGETDPRKKERWVGRGVLRCMCIYVFPSYVGLHCFNCVLFWCTARCVVVDGWCHNISYNMHVRCSLSDGLHLYLSYEVGSLINVFYPCLLSIYGCPFLSFLFSILSPPCFFNFQPCASLFPSTSNLSITYLRSWTGQVPHPCSFRPTLRHGK